MATTSEMRQRCGDAADYASLMSDLLKRLEPMLEEAKAENDRLRANGAWSSEAERKRYHKLVASIYADLEPLLQSLVQAGILSATFHERDSDRFAWFEIDGVAVAGTIDFSGRQLLESTWPPPRLY